MKITPTSLYLAAAIALSLLLIIFSAAVQKAECSVTNGSIKISDTLPDDEEFPMESETVRRILAVVNYNALKPKLPFCDRGVYGSCVPNPNPRYRNQCTYNDCLRPAQ